MSINLTVRSATVDDAQGIIDILNPIIEDGRFTVLDTPFTVEAERAFIQNFPERGIISTKSSSKSTSNYSSKLLSKIPIRSLYSIYESSS
jgi:hypothetical protein